MSLTPTTKAPAVKGAKSPCGQTAARVAVIEETLALHRARIAALEVQLSRPAQLELQAAPLSGGVRDAVPEHPDHTPLEAATGLPRGSRSK